MFLAIHESMRRRGYCGQNSMLIVGLEGELDRSELSAAAGELGRRYPALSAHIRYTPLLRRAMWHIPGDAALEDAIEYEHHAVARDGAAAWEPLQRALGESIDPHVGRQLRLVHVEIGAGRHRLGIVGPHHLMDMEGTHLLLRELHAILSGEPPALGQAPDAPDGLPFSWKFPQSELRAMRGWIWFNRYARYARGGTVVESPGERKTPRFLARTYAAERRRQFQELAKRRCTPGPLLYTRALMIGAARVTHQIATERGAPRDHYLFSQTLPMPRRGPRLGLHGNYVAIPWIVFAAEELEDWALADAAAVRQFEQCEQQRFAEAFWDMCRTTRRWPLAVTRALLNWQIPPGTASCTAYRFGADTSHLGRARITNLGGAATVNCPPGRLVGLTTFRDSMTIDMTFFEDHFTPAAAADFLRRLEEELWAARIGSEPACANPAPRILNPTP